MKEKPTAKQLSKGLAIEYKAFARSFQSDEGSVLYLLATCYYMNSGFTIFFEKGAQPNQFNLMETPPTGIHRQIVTYYVASWTNGVSAAQTPTVVSITDSQGSRQVNVQPW